ncbi:MAG: NAD(P)H-dependent oxidoreductase [Holosporales bacterium]|jgi:NAD(P)H dehydrogenase (quinone)
MTKNILIITGHPAHERESFCEALANAYNDSAFAAGHTVRRINIAALRFDPILHEGYLGNQPPEPDIIEAQEKISWAQHIVIVYPLWAYMIPALLKGFLERCFTKGFAFEVKSKNPFRHGLLRGKSVRLLQTMGMPALVYRFYYGAHGAKALKSMLKFCGLAPVQITYFGMIEGTDERRKGYLERAKELGKRGA